MTLGFLPDFLSSTTNWCKSRAGLAFLLMQDASKPSDQIPNRNVFWNLCWSTADILCFTGPSLSTQYHHQRSTAAFYKCSATYISITGWQTGLTATMWGDASGTTTFSTNELPWRKKVIMWKVTVGCLSQLRCQVTSFLDVTFIIAVYNLFSV